MKNRAITGEDYAIIFVKCKGIEKPCYIDIDMLPLVQRISEKLTWHDANGYVYCQRYSQGYKQTRYLHRTISRAESGRYVGFKDNNKYNLRRSNLKIKQGKR